MESDPSTATQLPAALARVGEALEADPSEPTCRRFERAAATWPGTYGCEVPSYERQAQLLSAFCEAGATLRLSRRACARANELPVDMTSPRDGSAHHGATASSMSTAIR